MRFGLFPLLVSASVAGCLAGLACSVTRPPSQPPGPTPADAERAPTESASGAEARPEQGLAKVPVSAADPQWGSVDAPVTIVEFSDFECPFCSRVIPTLKQLQDKYGPEKLRLVFKHNPLPFHPGARPAAEAAAAVHMLAGSRAFFVFQDLAFANQQSLTKANFESWASKASVRPPELKAWLDSGRAARKVEEDIELAEAVGATGTPAFRINGVVLSGAQPLEEFTKVIDAQLEAAKQLTDAGTPPRRLYATLTDKNFVEPAPPAPSAPDPADDQSQVWNIPIAADDPQRGEKDALVTIVEFSDYQCPYCKHAEETVEDLRRTYGKDLRVVWKDNPLPFHARALPAAQLARSVYQSKGNDAFWKVHDALFERQPKLEESDFEALAKELGLAWKPLQAALTSEKLKARITESIEQANDFQANGTPHFFINGRRLRGAQPLGSFKALIDEELVKAKALVEHGTPRAKVYLELTKIGASPPPPEQKHVALSPSAASRGNAQAPVVIQIFSDFQCPYCKRVEPTLSELEQEFKGSIRIVWRHLPLPFHKYAQEAAEAAEEVLAQKGAEAFWKYHDALFDAQGVDGGLSRSNLDAMADALGLDMSRFKAALDGHVHAAKVKADADAASAAGVNGTPSFTINDYWLSGAQPTSAFRKLVRLALKDRKKP